MLNAPPAEPPAAPVDSALPAAPHSPAAAAAPASTRPDHAPPRPAAAPDHPVAPVAAAPYDPANGDFVGPDGRHYTQTDVANSGPKSWENVVLPSS